MAGLVPAIHVFKLQCWKGVDARDKRGHDCGTERSVPFVPAQAETQPSWPGLPGHPCLQRCNIEKTWMPATSAGMTVGRSDSFRSSSASRDPAVMAGLVPAIHVFNVAMLKRRGCPRQARAWLWDGAIRSVRPRASGDRWP